MQQAGRGAAAAIRAYCRLPQTGRVTRLAFAGAGRLTFGVRRRVPDHRLRKKRSRVGNLTPDFIIARVSPRVPPPPFAAFTPPGLLRARLRRFACIALLPAHLPPGRYGFPVNAPQRQLAGIPPPFRLLFAGRSAALRYCQFAPPHSQC